MKKEIKIFAILMFFQTLSFQVGLAQSYKDTMDAIFEHVDKSRISTGLLSDYGVQMVDINAFNGIPSDSNYVDVETWKKLYNGLYSSKINSNANMLSPKVVINRINNEQIVNNAVPLTMMHFKYNKLINEAVYMGLLQIIDNKIYEVPGASAPYYLKNTFAVAPKSIVFNSLTVSFVFKPWLWFSNSNKTVSDISVKFDNESNYRHSNWDVPITHTFIIGGVKTISFKLKYTDGTTYVSRTKIIVNKTHSQMIFGSGRRDSLVVSATNEHSGGKFQFYYSSSNNTLPKKFRKTLIVAEGYDPSVILGSNNMGILDFLDDGIGGISVSLVSPNSNASTLLKRIDELGYDIVYVDNANGVDDIRRNAKLFEYAIDYVNANKDGDYENVVMGISMGGLVARYALRKMEIAGKGHNACKYISIDSPHKGANVPVGAQALIRHIESLDVKLFWFFTVLNMGQVDNNIENAIKLLNSKATKQLLMYYVTKDLTYDNSEHESFMSEYESLGVPHNCQNIAIANGSNIGIKYFPPQTELIKIDETVGLKWWQEMINVVLGRFSFASLITNYPQLAINAIPGKTEFSASIVAKSLPNMSVQSVYDGRLYIKKKLLFTIPVEVDITNKSLYSTNDMLAVDGAPGGNYPIPTISNNSISTYLKQTDFCFIPTVSAIGLSNWKNKITSALNNVNFYAYSLSPFRYYFSQSMNTPHTKFNQSAAFLDEHFTSNCIIPEEIEEDVYIQNMTISADRYFRGRNIFIGNSVTDSVPQGNVLINNGAKVIFDGKKVVFDKGFECINSTYETKKH